MIKIPIETIYSKIREGTGMTSEQVEAKVQEKLTALSGLISKEGAAHILANEAGIKLIEAPGKMKIKDIHPGMRDVEIIGIIRAVFEPRTFVREGKEGRVGSLFLADETGSIRVTAWHDQCDHLLSLVKGDMLKIQGGLAKENRGQNEVHLTSQSKVTRNPPGEVITALPERRATRKKISELTEQDDAAELFGTIVQIYTPRYFEVCPTCSGRIREADGFFRCERHGTVTPIYSPVVTIELDDGSDTMRIACFRKEAESLTRKTFDELAAFREHPEQFETIKTELLGEMIKITGRVKKNNMFNRLEFTAQQIVLNPDPDEELKRLQAVAL